MARMLGPAAGQDVLSFTADEIWQSMPHAKADDARARIDGEQAKRNAMIKLKNGPAATIMILFQTGASWKLPSE